MKVQGGAAFNNYSLQWKHGQTNATAPVSLSDEEALHFSVKTIKGIKWKDDEESQRETLIYFVSEDLCDFTLCYMKAV